MPPKGSGRKGPDTRVRSVQERNDLVDRYLYLWLVAYKRNRSKARMLGLDEFRQICHLALIQAASHWREQGGKKFEWYAYRLIRWRLKLEMDNEMNYRRRYRQALYRMIGEPNDHWPFSVIDNLDQAKVLAKLMMPRIHIDHRYAVEQHIMKGRKLRSIAKEMDCTGERVRQLVAQGVERLRRLPPSRSFEDSYIVKYGGRYL